MRSELNYAGKNLSEFGMWFDNSKVYKKPAKRFMGYDIPARNGTLYQSENKFNNVIIEFDCFIKDNFDQNYHDLVNYLNSFETYQKLINSYNTDMFRMALFHEAVEVDTGQFLKDGRFKLFFDCKPQEYYADGAEFERIAPHSDIYTGNPVKLVNEGESSVISLRVALEPIQTGSGEPSPSNIRPIYPANGKNLLQNTATSQTVNGVTFTVNADGTVKANGTASSAAEFVIKSDVSGNTYAGMILSGCPSGGGGSTYRLFEQVQGSPWTYLASDGGSGVTLPTTTYTTVRFIIRVESGVSVNNLVFKPMIRPASITDSTYQPYQGVVVTRTGKNFLPSHAVGSTTTNGVTFTANANGTITVNGTATAEAQYAITISNLTGNYYFSGCPSGGSGTSYELYAWDYTASARFKKWNGTTASDSDFGTGSKEISIPSSHNGALSIRIRNGYTANNLVFKPMLRLASETDATYEPYTGNTYTINLNGTRYGGTVDLVTGVLTLTKGFKNITASDNVQTVGSSGHGWQVLNSSLDIPPLNTGANYSDGIICDRLKSEVGASSVADDLCFINSSGVLRFNLATVYADKTALFAALGEINVSYPIEPQTIQLTPQQINLLTGINYISSSGEVTVTTSTPLILKNPSPMTAKPIFKFTNISAPFTVSANGETIISFQNAIRLVKAGVVNNMFFNATGTNLNIQKQGTPNYEETSFLINSGWLPAGRYFLATMAIGNLEVTSMDGTHLYSSGGTFTLTDMTQVKVWYVITPNASTPQNFNLPIFLRPLGTLYVDSELMDCYMLDGDTAYSFNECVNLPKDFLQLDERTVMTMTSGAVGFIAPNWWRL